MEGIAEIPLWSDEDYRRLGLRLISDRDGEWQEFAASNETIKNRGYVGEQIKEFLIDLAGNAWMAKSGALTHQQIHNVNQNSDPSVHIDEETELGRRIAFPLHVALVPNMLRAIGILSNEIALGRWRMKIPPADHGNEELRVAFHKMLPATRRDSIQGFQPNPQYVDDLATLRFFDRIIGQIDHLSHNLMVKEDDQRLVAIENGLCMKARWLTEDCDFDGLSASLSGEPEFQNGRWTPELRARVIDRLRPLTEEFIERAFHALPDEWTAYHDKLAPSGKFLCASMDVKIGRVKENLMRFIDWAKAFG